MKIQSTPQHRQSRISSTNFGDIEIAQIRNPRVLTAIEQICKKFQIKNQISINETGQLNSLLTTQSNPKQETAIIRLLNKFFSSEKKALAKRKKM